MCKIFGQSLTNAVFTKDVSLFFCFSDSSDCKIFSFVKYLAPTYRLSYCQYIAQGPRRPLGPSIPGYTGSTASPWPLYTWIQGPRRPLGPSTPGYHRVHGAPLAPLYLDTPLYKKVVCIQQGCGPGPGLGPSTKIWVSHKLPRFYTVIAYICIGKVA